MVRALGPAIALALACPVAVGATTVAFDSFGPGNAYDTSSGGLVGPGPTGDVELGLVFTAQATGRIGTLTVAMSSTAPPSVATFTLYEWTGTSRGRQVDLGPAKVPSGDPEVIEIGDWSGSVAEGAQYALFATAPTAAVWKAALSSAAGRMVYLIDGAGGDEPGWSAAARIELDSVGAPVPVPLPATLPMVAGALGALALISRRRAR